MLYNYASFWYIFQPYFNSRTPLKQEIYLQSDQWKTFEKNEWNIKIINRNIIVYSKNSFIKRIKYNFSSSEWFLTDFTSYLHISCYHVHIEGFYVVIVESSQRTSEYSLHLNLLSYLILLDSIVIRVLYLFQYEIDHWQCLLFIKI